VNGVTVVVGHREAMLAEGIAAALDRCPGIVPVGWATTLDEIIRLGGPADAVVIDAGLPGAPLAAGRLRRAGVRVVFLGDRASDRRTNYVSTHSPTTSLAAALYPWAAALPPARPCLTSREREVLGLVAKGLAARQVARQLGISHKTVERHKTRIFSKLGVPNAAAAVGFIASVEREGDAA
jgi:DNA-binding CsgD family transcriptional regulator